MTPYAIEIRRLTKDYGPRRVLDIDHFAVGTRSVCVVVGPNGSGKTTLLGVLALLEPQTAGRVLWSDGPRHRPTGSAPASRRGA